MAPCSTCGAELETPLGCSSCGTLAALDPAPTPFAAFGLEASYAVDTADLKKRLTRFSRILHPDFYATAEPEVRALAERNSAVLNEAHEILASDTRRADWLVGHLGGPGEGEERQMPQEFLMEVLEWNETLEEAQQAGASTPALDGLETELTAKRREVLATVASLLTPLPAPGDPRLVEVRKALNALRYLDRSLAQVEGLRLDQAASRN